MVILLLASTACRIGALPGLTLGNLTKLPDLGLYRIVFYDGSSSEYYSFCTRECVQTGIDNYLEYRKRCGEKLSFNEKKNRWEPEGNPLIRLSFDATDSFQASRQVKPITLHDLRAVLDIHLVRCGLRQVEHTTEHKRRVRKSIALANGFRKRCVGIFIEAGLNHEIRELICNHTTQLDAAISDQQRIRFSEYLKSESYLTIDPSTRLAQGN
jgi:hypothetical protein